MKSRWGYVPAASPVVVFRAGRNSDGEELLADVVGCDSGILRLRCLCCDFDFHERGVVVPLTTAARDLLAALRAEVRS